MHALSMKKKRAVFVKVPEQIGTPGSDAGDERRELVQRFVQKLPEQQRLTLLLKHVRGNMRNSSIKQRPVFPNPREMK